MTAGVIPVTSIPNWPTPPSGLQAAVKQSLDNAGIHGHLFIGPDGLHTPDVANTQNVLNTYVGGADELNFHKTAKQTQLDALIDANFDLEAFIRNGTLTNITGTNVGNYLAQITNNYRSLRSQISAGSTAAAVDAININAGWPSNP